MKTVIEILNDIENEWNKRETGTDFLEGCRNGGIYALREAKERIQKEDNQNYEMPNSTEALTDFLNRNGEKMVPTIQKETQWISVEDRLPDPDMNVLVVYKGFNNHTGVMEVSTDCERDGKTLDFYSHCMGIITYKVTHWMPLPLPPNE